MAQRVASGCLVFHDGNCLLLRRSALEDTMQGLWEMPAGKIESDLDGSPEENAIRETLEEAGIALGNVVPLGEHLTEVKRFYGFLGVSDTADVELSFEHDAFVWMPVPDILAAVAADDMMVGHHTVYFLQQLLDDAEGLIYEAESFAAETFAADSCIECGRKEGPYADTVLIACPGCPELTCQRCYDEEKQGCLFCIRKRAETVSDDVPSDYYNNTPMVIQDLLTQSGGDCDKCGENVPNGKAHYPKADKELGDDDDTRICLSCFEADPNFTIYNEVETFSAEKITKDELIEYLDWLENGFGFFFDNSPQAQRFYDLLAGDLQINSADVDFTDEDEFILLGAEGLPRGVVVKSFKTVSNVYYNGKLYRKFEGLRHRERAESIAEWMMQKLSQNPRRFDYLRFGAEDYSEEDALADSIIGQTIFNYVQIRDYLRQNLTDEAIEFLDYNIQVAFDELIDEDMRQQVEHVMNTNRFEAEFESESLTGKDMSYCKCGTKDEVGGFTCGQHCSRIEKNGETFEARFVRSLNNPRQLMPWDLEPNMAEEGMPYLTRREYDDLIRMGYKDEEIRKGYQGSYEAESTSKPARVEIKRATIDPYKLTAVFYDKDDKKIKTTHFGDERYEDYTIHKDKERLKNYNTRHGAKSAGEKWQKPMTAGALSKWILWNKPSLKASFDDYKRRFKLKGDLKAKTSGGRKRAETFATEYTPSQTLGDYDARELALSSVATGDFFTDSLKFSTTRMASEEEDAKKLREYEKTYGKKQAKIRMRLKKKIYKERSMGTKAGQWSARKSQKLKREYEKACERAGLKPYKTGKTEKQEDLEDWSDQDWKTSSGKKSSKTGEPYFPAKAVEALKKKGLYAKAKRQKAKATKAGKQNARYSDDIRKVVAKYRAESFQADTDVVLYFGTSTQFLTDIERFGLSDPMLTLDLAVADDYAMATAEQYGGNAIVVEVSAFADLLDRVDWQGNIFEYYGDIPPAALYVMDWDERTGSWS